ncbi:MAG: carbohydrate ABC transporter substrate-binding protein [Anaerolineae bacterium]|nr:carbohydrate ABC transporter substrate-binding protein [Anaerolineae bacterium]
MLRMFLRKKQRAALVVSTLLILVLTMPTFAQGTTITFLTPPWGVPPDEAALTAFEEASGITVEIQSVQSADLFSRVQVAAASGQAAADVIFLTEEAPSNIVATGNMLALNDLIAATADLDLTDFNKVDFWTQDGQTYGIPTYLQLVMMDYNTARLAEAGFDAAPTTWAELTDMARALKEQGVDEYPIALGAIDWSWYLIALSMGDPMFDADLNPVFADEGSKAREAMNLLLSYFSDELISPEILAGSINQHSLFWSGVGTFHQGWQGSIAVGNNPDTSQQAPNVAYLPLPEVGNTWSFPAAIGISANSANAEAAWEFIQWYVAPEQQEAIYNAFGLYPSRTSVGAALNEAGVIAGYDAILAQSDRINELPRYTLWWGPFTQSVSETILQAAQTGMSGDEVIDALAESWNDLRSEYE